MSVVDMSTSQCARIPRRPRLSEVNTHLTCVLCRGYYIDATTIVECLHSFCRSCIIQHLQVKSYCPVCDMMINAAKPNIKPDKALQDIVYKLVPGLFQREMRRRRLFYSGRPDAAIAAAAATPEQRGEDTERLVFSPGDQISLSLEYSESTDCDNASNSQSNSGDSEGSCDNHNGPAKRYLECPAVVTICHLKKFLVNKYDINTQRFHIDVLYKRVPLPDHYTLMDIAYIYTWKRNAPMRFFYRVIDVNFLRERFDYFEPNSKLVAEKTDEKPVDTIIKSERQKQLPKDKIIEKQEIKSETKTVKECSSKKTEKKECQMKDKDIKLENDIKDKKEDDIVVKDKVEENKQIESLVLPNVELDSHKVNESVEEKEFTDSDNEEKSQFLNSFELKAKKSLSPTKSEKSDGVGCMKLSPNSAPLKITSPKVDSIKITSPKVSPIKITSPKVSPSKTTVSKVSPLKVSTPKVSPQKTSPAKVVSPKVTPLKVTLPKLSAPKMVTLKASTPKLAPPKGVSAKVSTLRLIAPKPITAKPVVSRPTALKPIAPKPVASKLQSICPKIQSVEPKSDPSVNPSNSNLNGTAPSTAAKRKYVKSDSKQPNKKRKLNGEKSQLSNKVNSSHANGKQIQGARPMLQLNDILMNPVVKIESSKDMKNGQTPPTGNNVGSVVEKEKPNDSIQKQPVAQAPVKQPRSQSQPKGGQPTKSQETSPLLKSLFNTPLSTKIVSPFMEKPVVNAVTPASAKPAQKRKPENMLPSPPPMKKFAQEIIPIPTQPKVAESASTSPLQSLFDSCNINIPSSLSITLTDAPRDAVPSKPELLGTPMHNGLRKTQLGGMTLTEIRSEPNSVLSSDGSLKRASPVNNYIEILKLPDKTPSSNISADNKPSQTGKLEGANASSTQQTNGSKGPGPVPNLNPIDPKGNHVFTKPQTFQQTFLQSLQQQSLQQQIVLVKPEVTKPPPVTYELNADGVYTKVEQPVAIENNEKAKPEGGALDLSTPSTGVNKRTILSIAQSLTKKQTQGPTPPASSHPMNAPSLRIPTPSGRHPRPSSLGSSSPSPSPPCESPRHCPEYTALRSPIGSNSPLSPRLSVPNPSSKVSPKESKVNQSNLITSSNPCPSPRRSPFSGSPSSKASSPRPRQSSSTKPTLSPNSSPVPGSLASMNPAQMTALAAMAMNPSMTQHAIAAQQAMLYQNIYTNQMRQTLEMLATQGGYSGPAALTQFVKNMQNQNHFKPGHPSSPKPGKK